MLSPRLEAMMPAYRDDAPPLRLALVSAEHTSIRTVAFLADSGAELFEALSPHWMGGSLALAERLWSDAQDFCKRAIRLGILAPSEAPQQEAASSSGGPTAIVSRSTAVLATVPAPTPKSSKRTRVEPQGARQACPKERAALDKQSVRI